MTQRDLARLEAAIGRPLSPAVRQFFLNFPPELHISDDERDPDTDDFDLTDDTDSLIQLNKPGVGGLVPYNAEPRMFMLGCGGCGETWWVDLDDECGAVYFFDAGTDVHDSDRVADSIDEFARGMIGSDEE
jgi:hypothetical protein